MQEAQQFQMKLLKVQEILGLLVSLQLIQELIHDSLHLDKALQTLVLGADPRHLLLAQHACPNHEAFVMLR